MNIGMLVAVAAQILIAIGSAHAGNTNNGIHVPEPASLALLSVGAAVVAAGAWWRNRK
jgi:PEP-CTERM motif